MLNFNSVMLNTGNVKELADFYEKIFDKKPDMADETYCGWKVGSCFFTVGAHSEITGNAKDPDRILFNFETTNIKEEFERISKIEGVTVVKEPYNPMTGEEESQYSEEQMKNFWVATLADPDGNYFQLMSPWKM